MNRRHFISSSSAAIGATVFSASAAEAMPKTVWGIAELWQWLYERQVTSGHDSADCLQAHLDHGIRHVVWALGRSTLDYQSALPTSTMYAGDTRPETKVIGDSFRQECSLRAAVAFATKNDMVIYGRLGMNRHYGDSLGGALRSKYIAGHPEWLERASRRSGGWHEGELCGAGVSRGAHRGAAGGSATRSAWAVSRLLPPAARGAVSSVDRRALAEGGS